jgi:putative pyruvate formate lyase activating enzyme
VSRIRELAASGILEERLEALKRIGSPCTLCPRRCGVDREGGETGCCGATAELEVASIVMHGGEEPVLTGGRAVGNVFLPHCNLSCVYCQNSQISQTRDRFPMTPRELARELLGLQEAGCPTLGFVSPTIYVPQIVEALATAVADGLDRPLIYNSNGYDSVEVIRLLDGIFDIYLPDFKYAGEAEASEYSGAPGYPDAAIEAIREMYRQVGDLELDSGGVAVSGVIVRHLVLPNDIARTREALARIASEISDRVSVSLMAQYNPLHKAAGFPLLSRKLRRREYEAAVEALEDLGMAEGWTQDWKESPDSWVPDFDMREPFGTETEDCPRD